MDRQTDTQSMDHKREPAESNSNIPSSETATPPAALESVVSQKLLGYGDHGSLDESMQAGAQDSGYNSSGSSAHHSPTETLSGGVQDGELVRTRSRASSRTSISSIPASVLTNLPDVVKPMNVRDSQDYGFQPWEHHGHRSVHTIRQRETTFRKPSSVRAMQMHTEDEGDDDYHLTPPKRRGSQRTSDISIRSAGSLPFKRSSFYSLTGAAGKPKVKKEYPLVLLHCTLLSPSLPVAGLVEHPDRQKILSDVLPSVYWKRWKLLEEKIGSGVLRERGVLISHPEDMYDLLEERLLESLELQHPRLDHGHFLGRDETESDKEDRLAREDSSTEDEGDECPDCGGRVLRHNATRKWEVKVFAANGLMRAGAWAAAWKEMEKVDVEVGLWLPPDVRAELEKRLAEDSSHKENGLPISLLQGPENIPVETPTRALTPSPPKVDPLPHITQHCERSSSPVSNRVRPQDDQKGDFHASKPSEDIDLQTLLVNYIRVLASDRRNIAIVFLSVLVVYVAIHSKPTASAPDLRPFPSDIPDYATSSMVPLQKPVTQTWTENTSTQILSDAVSIPTEILESSADPGTFSSLYDLSDTLVESSRTEREDLPSTATDTLSIESSGIVIEEQEQPKRASENELEKPEKPSPNTAEALSVESTEIVPEEQAEPQTRETEPEESLPTTAISEEEELSQASETEPGEPLPNTIKTASVASVHTISEEKEFSQTSNTAPGEQALDTAASMDTAGDDKALPQDQSEQDDQAQQIEREPDVLDEQNEGNEQNDINDM
ncbi:hypothetical protein BDW62DRAFT_192406 [Aspergillus aurantiobrunneus]